DLLDGLEFGWRALDGKLSRLPHEVVFRSLQEMGRDLPGLVAHFPRRHRRGGAGRRRGTARVGAETVGSGVRVAFLDLDVGGGNAQLFGEDLRVGRLVALALGLRAEQLGIPAARSEEHTSELQSRSDLVCRLLLEKKKKK